MLIRFWFNWLRYDSRLGGGLVQQQSRGKHHFLSAFLLHSFLMTMQSVWKSLKKSHFTTFIFLQNNWNFVHFDVKNSNSKTLIFKHCEWWTWWCQEKERWRKTFFTYFLCRFNLFVGKRATRTRIWDYSTDITTAAASTTIGTAAAEFSNQAHCTSIIGLWLQQLWWILQSTTIVSSTICKHCRR